MIRTLLITTALLAAAAGAAQADTLLTAGPAQAATLKVSISGKTESAVKAEIAKASELVCRDTVAIEYAACVHETYQNAMTQLDRIKAVRTASLTF